MRNGSGWKRWWRRWPTLGCQGESVAEVAHDARNMVTALGLYCDLLEEPGVLATPFTHYGNELRLVAAASRRLVEKLVALDAGERTQRACSRPELRGDRESGSAAARLANAAMEPSRRGSAGDRAAGSQQPCWSAARQSAERTRRPGAGT